MKVKLTCDVPVDNKHGMKKDRVFEVDEFEDGNKRGTRSVWVTGDAGERVKLLWREYSEVEQ